MGLSILNRFKLTDGMIYAIVENTRSSVKKIYNSKLTMTKNMKSSIVKRLCRSTENTVDFLTKI